MFLNTFYFRILVSGLFTPVFVGFVWPVFVHNTKPYKILSFLPVTLSAPSHMCVSLRSKPTQGYFLILRRSSQHSLRLSPCNGVHLIVHTACPGVQRIGSPGGLSGIRHCCGQCLALHLSASYTLVTFVQ